MEQQKISYYNDPIDIVIPWLNSDDEEWKKTYVEWKKKESSSETNDDDFNGECRFRDMGTIKYVLRSIYSNCPWVHKVFLILSGPTQIPDWLNTDCKKLRIVYHNEYIPSELLPTFNSNVIENFLYRLPDLSNNYILCNDDTIFMKKMDETKFFMFNFPVLTGNYKHVGKFPEGNLYWDMLNNNMDLEYKYEEQLGMENIRYDHMHLMVPHKKSFEKLIWLDNYEYLYNALSASHFRSSKNITHLLFNDLCEITGYYIQNKNLYNRSFCINMPDNFNVKSLDFCDLVCYNDTSSISPEHYEDLKNRLINHLNELFRTKSIFEV